MRNRITLTIALLLVALSLSACGKAAAGSASASGGASSSASSSAPDASVSTPETTPEAVPEDPQTVQPENQADEIETKPAETKPQTTKPAETKPQTSKPQTSKPQANAPTTKPEAKPEVKNPTVDELRAAVEKALGEIPMLTALSADDLSSVYGLDPAALSEFSCKMPMMNVHATEFFVAKVADGKMDTVKAALEKRHDTLDNTWKQYLQDQYEMVQNYKIVANGNYVLFVVAENADAAVTAFNNLTK